MKSLRKKIYAKLVGVKWYSNVEKQLNYPLENRISNRIWIDVSTQIWNNLNVKLNNEIY